MDSLSQTKSNDFELDKIKKKSNLLFRKQNT